METEDEYSGGQTSGQKAILRYLLQQLETEVFEGLNDESRRLLRESFGADGFAWARSSVFLHCFFEVWNTMYVGCNVEREGALSDCKTPIHYAYQASSYDCIQMFFR
jgi:hypothetical protein